MAIGPLSLGRLAAIYLDALRHREHTIAFEVAVGKGRFVFLIFFSDEDKAISDTLFLLLRNTSYVFKRKMYGSHTKGGTNVYIEPEHERAIRAELQLTDSGPAFELRSFFAQLNSLIPQKLPLRDTVKTLRENWNAVMAAVPNIVESELKTELSGLRQLDLPKQPKEVTLRKLYLHCEGSPSDIEHLIAKLKSKNKTLVWRVPDPSRPPRPFTEIFADL